MLSRRRQLSCLGADLTENRESDGRDGSQDLTVPGDDRAPIRARERYAELIPWCGEVRAVLFKRCDRLGL
jgi:hypothetical protein